MSPCLRGVELLGLPFFQIPSTTTVQDTVFLASPLSVVIVSEIHRIQHYEWKTTVRTTEASRGVAKGFARSVLRTSV